MGARKSKAAKSKAAGDAKVFDHPGLGDAARDSSSRTHSARTNESACPRQFTIGLEEEPAGGWRHGKPNYDQVIAKWKRQKETYHENGSLEETVENLVKEWEAEASHKKDPKDWKTIDIDNWYLSGNAGSKVDAFENVEVGNYNALMNDVDDLELYNHEMTWDESHEKFRDVFKTGFAWEVTECFTGPPKIAFSWRHWGHLGTETLQQEEEGDGQLVEMKGFAIANVTIRDGNILLQGVETYFDSKGFLNEIKEWETQQSFDEQEEQDAVLQALTE